MPTLLHPDGHLVIDDNGNFAFGTFSLNTWYSAVSALHLAESVALSWSKMDSELNIICNAYQVAASDWRYRQNGFARRVVIDNSYVAFYHAASGIQDAAITWIQDLSISAPGHVSVGDVVSTFRLGVQPNNAFTLVPVGGTLSVSTTTTGNSTTIDSLLGGDVIDANVLGVNGQSVRFEAFGTPANNANVKTIRVRFGGVVIATRTMTPSVANNWFLQGTLYRRGAASQKAVVVFMDGSIQEVDTALALTADLTISNSLSIFGQGGATNDLVLQGFKYSWDDFNS